MQPPGDTVSEAVKRQDLRVSGWSRLLLAAPFIALVALEIDQLSKLWVRETLAIGESVLREGSLRITHVVNPGVIFGIPASPLVSLILPIAVILICLIIYWRFERTDSTLLNLGIGLFIGGSLGNLVDRIAYGQVTDFIELVFSGRGVTIVFNVADLCVILGLVMVEVFLIGVIIGLIRKRGLRYNPMTPFFLRHIPGRRTGQQK